MRASGGVCVLMYFHIFHKPSSGCSSSNVAMPVASFALLTKVEGSSSRYVRYKATTMRAVAGHAAHRFRDIGGTTLTMAASTAVNVAGSQYLNTRPASRTD